MDGQVKNADLNLQKMATEILRPTGDGDEENIENATSGAGNHWDDVNDVVPDGDTTKVWQSTWPTDARDLYLIANSGVGAGVINKITVYIYCQTTNIYGSAIVRAAIKTGGNAFESDDLLYTAAEGWHYETWEWAVNPDTTNAWTWGEIDLLQAGLRAYAFETKGTQQTKATQVYVEVDYVGVGTNMKVNISDVFKDISEIKVNIGDVWKDVTKIQINIGDAWKTVFG